MGINTSGSVCHCAVLFLFFCTCFVPFISCCQSRWSRKPTPTLEFEPLPKTTSDDTLIWYKPYDRKSNRYWINRLDTFLKPYTTNQKPETVVECNRHQLPPKNKVCDFKITRIFAPCTSEFHYGYESSLGGPCVFLRLTKTSGWLPRWYNGTDLPSEMPRQLKQRIETEERRGTHQMVWVYCNGENAADMENVGPISYMPYQGFDVKYFPASEVEGYLSPLVAVFFENPQRGVLIRVECTAWAHNIIRNRDNKLGFATFELLID